MEDHHRYIDNLDKFEQVFLLIHSVHVPWGHKLMQKRNEKIEVGLRPQRKLKGFECSTRQAHHQICQNAIIFQKKKGRQKREKRHPSQIFRKELGCVCCCAIHDQKGTKRKCSGERSYPDSNRGNQKFFDISSL